MKKLLYCTLPFIIFSVFFACKEQKTQTTEEILAKEGRRTQIAQLNGIQFAFDLTTLAFLRRNAQDHEGPFRPF